MKSMLRRNNRRVKPRNAPPSFGLSLAMPAHHLHKFTPKLC
ncbi:hypothetical protein [Sphingobium sp. EP60837]|nr:hypothetical protein [Sphingobium sp. EP60837]